jgi:hypothetical protein
VQLIFDPVYKLVRIYEPSSRETYATTRASLTIFSQYHLLGNAHRLFNFSQQLSLSFFSLLLSPLVSVVSPTSTGDYRRRKSMVGPTRQSSPNWNYLAVINFLLYRRPDEIEILTEGKLRRKYDPNTRWIVLWRVGSSAKDLHRINIVVVLQRFHVLSHCIIITRLLYQLSSRTMTSQILTTMASRTIYSVWRDNLLRTPTLFRLLHILLRRKGGIGVFLDAISNPHVISLEAAVVVRLRTGMNGSQPVCLSGLTHATCRQTSS